MLEWVQGFDLITRRPTYVPLNCVVAPYSVSGLPLFYTSTNGLASGNTRVEAVCHALCKVIERDATALAIARAELAPAVAASWPISGSVMASRRRSAERCDDFVEGLPRRAAALVGKLQRAGLEVELQT